MSLLDIAKSIKKDGFDPRKDSVDGQSALPAGTYPVVLRKATFNISDSGWERLGYQFEVRGGDHNGRNEFVTFGTLEEWKGKDMSDFVKRTMKFFIKALNFSGDTMRGDEEDGKALEEALQRKAVGSYYNLVIRTYKKKDGSEGRSYDLKPETSQPMMSADEIDDDDLPF